ncbi:UDP-glucose 4-epimerase [Halobacteroides halobius DSM 5150]|uniref:UDP-glucose 4-epimerase n=1 Tax=Halobacteroides halobius (strain ATCC 35273 / DSM 5150 / MD-1) TaxID=748449 RepID=L0KCH3_HALHC|nr:SDR family oxidoreductase [Halobacteroides halobius]AGB42250.1 UDP-glucose 4-epimerase [Halobacteroides halobius DSM 5150]
MFLRTVLVTGGAGFIGSHIVDKLIAKGDRVIVVDNLSTGKKENLNPQAEFYQLDIRDDLTEVFENYQIDYVIHQAAQIDVQQSLEQPDFDSDVNITGTVNLLEYCRQYDVEKIVYASSAAVYGQPEYLGVDEEHPVNPISYYGISKHTPEHYLKVFHQLYDLDYTILRYANAYGIRQDPKGEGGVISIFVDKFLQGEQPIIFGDGEQTRDFVYVDDIAEANLAALEHGSGEIINISCNIQTSINDLVATMNQITGLDLKTVYQGARSGDIRDSYLVNDKAQDILDWEPQYDLQTGLKETFAYYRDQYNLNQEIAATKE